MAGETKICKYCLTEIPKEAKICPNCRKKQGKRILPIILIIIAALVIICVVFGNSDDNSGSTSTTSTTTQEAKTDVNKAGGEDVNKDEVIEYKAVTAAELEEALDDNALKASDTYKDQYIEVTGYLSTIDSSGDYIFIDAGGNDWSLTSIQCIIKNDEQKSVIMEMSDGDPLVIKGRCTDVGEFLGYEINIEEISAK